MPNTLLPGLYNSSFPPSGTGQYSTVRCDSGQYTLIWIAFPLPTVPLLDSHVVCWKVANNVILAQRRMCEIVCVYVCKNVKL